MPETYSKSCQISKMMRHIERPGTVRTVFSSIFWHIPRHSAIFSHVQAYSGTLRYFEAYLSIIKAYWALFSHRQNSLYLLHMQPCHIQNAEIFITQAISKSLSNMWNDQAYSYPWHSQNIKQAFSRIFSDIKISWCILIHTHRCATRWEGDRSCCPFLKIEKMFWFEKSPWLCLYLGCIFNSNCSFVVV